MTDTLLGNPTRRAMLAGTGAFVVSFSTLARAFAQQGEVQGTAPPPKAPLPGSLAGEPFLDAWIRIDASGKVTVFTGKAELGQGLKTAIPQIAAEELEIDPLAIELITADTGRTPDEGFTAGSQSMQNSGTAIRHAAAQIREMLIAEAGRRLGATPDTLRAENGAVVGGGQSLPYGELIGNLVLHVEAQPQSKLKDPAAFRHMGKSMQRVDIPGKVTGGEAFVQDMRLSGMVHARLVRPPSYSATISAVDTTAVEKMPGVVKVVRDGNFLAVVAEREWQAIKAMRALQAAVQWSESARLPDPNDLYPTLERLVSQDGIVADEHKGPPPTGRTIQASYSRPYQMHASIGPSAAVAWLENGQMTVWTHTQGVYPDRKAIAQMLGMPLDQVRCIHSEGAGCYGHNGADDAAADAALIARAVPGRPVRVQWMREQEHAYEPYGPAMFGRVQAQLTEDGRITNWDYGVWTNTHTTRPGNAGSLYPARLLAKPFQLAEAKMEINPSGNGDRNAIPLYAFPHKHIVWHFIKDMPLRVSALRGLGAFLNVFSIESFMDELAAEAGVDPVEFRLRHLEEPRGRDVVTLAAEKFGWTAAANLPENHGRGFAFARYKNHAAYCAVAIEVEVEPETGRTRVLRAVSAVDTGEIVNPDGVRNQIEGGILQSISWTLYESVSFDQTRIRSVDWASYPILRFNAVPDSVEVHLVPRPNTPFLGVAEASQGPTGAAVANAIADATGKRLRDVPLTRDKIKAAIGV